MSRIEQLLLFGLWVGSLYSLLAVSLGLVRSVCAFFNFLSLGLITAGGYLQYFMVVLLSFPHSIAALLTIVVGALLGGALDVAVFRRLRNSGAGSGALLVASLALLLIIQNSLALFFGDQRLNIESPGGGVIRLGLGHLTITQVATIGIAAIAGLLTLTLQNTKPMMVVRAVSIDRELAQVRGIRVDVVSAAVGALLGAVSCLTGVLWCYDTDLFPSMGMDPFLYSLVAATLGGYRYFSRAAVFGLSLGIFRYMVSFIAPVQWQETIVFLVLVFFMLWRKRTFYQMY